MLNEDETVSTPASKRLGRLPRKSTRMALQFSTFFRYADIPKTQTYWAKKPPIPLRSYRNLEMGCCTIAKQAVASVRFERIESRGRYTINIPDSEVVRRYTSLSDRLYGGGDNGAYEVDALCYSAGTEVLTRAGWKNFADVRVGENGDEFATRNPQTAAFEWQRATAFHESQFDGEMVRLRSKSVDLLVTPNHRVLVQSRPRNVRFYGDARRHGAEWLVQAGDLLAACEASRRPDKRLTRQLIPATSTWHCTAVAQWEAPSRPVVGVGAPPRAFAVTGDDWARFMGMYLAEGNVIRSGGTHQHEVWIAQNRKSKGFEPYRQLLRRILGKEPSYIGHQFAFPSRLLADYLRQFGKAHEKFVPDAIKDMPPKQLRLFWDHYVLGDGHVRPNGRTHIVTTSSRMADDLQEIAQKLGWSAMIKRTPSAPARFTTNGTTRLVAAENCRPLYTVYVRRTAFQSFVASPEAYSGRVRCVTVPNSVLYVRRNGRPSWCGNSDWRNPDTAMRDTHGYQHYIDAYLAINPANQDEVRAALALSSAKGIALCLNLPAAFSRLDPPTVWDVPKDQPLIGEWMPGSWGGHSLWGHGMVLAGPVQDHTWELPPNVITWEAWAAYCDEAHLIIDSVDLWRKRVTERRVKSALGDVADAVNAVSSIRIAL